MFARLASFMYHQRWYVVGAWLLLLLAALPFAAQVNSVLGPGNFVQPGSDSARASVLLDRKFHQNELRVSFIILSNRALTLHDPAFRAGVARVVARVRADRSLHVSYLDNPLVTGDRQFIAHDGHAVTLLVSSSLAEPTIEGQIEHLRSLSRMPGWRTFVTGEPASNHDYAVSTKEDLNRSESITVPILILLLLVVFGTVVAGILPLLLAGASIVLSLALVFAFAHVLDTSVYVTNVVTVLGLGVGIDYSLFIVYRFREELARTGSDVEQALAGTMTTTGRAVFFSGITVAVGLSSLILTGVSFMQSMGLGGMLVPITALAAAMTFLPAVLAVLGTRVNRWSVFTPLRALRIMPGRTATEDGGIWARWGRFVMRRPVLTGGITLLVLLALAFPVTRLTIAFGSLKNAPHNLESVAGVVYLRDHFPSTTDPVQVVVDRQGPGTLLPAAQMQGLARLERELRAIPGVKDVTGPADYLPAGGSPTTAQLRTVTGRLLSADRRTALIAVNTRYDAGTQQDSEVVRKIRALVHSRPMQSVLPGDAIVTGGTQASFDDWNGAVYAHFPLIIAVILVLTYAFLLYAFRSVFLPLKAVLLNLLSVLTAYGLLELVFQQGIGSSILSFYPESGVAGWVPIFLFAFLFGLSMDYEVFLISRIREGWLATRENEEAVIFGLSRTGRLISSAAAVMVIAFTGFLIGSQLQLKEFGFGLLAAIAVDASLIRLILVPAIMRLLGSVNWWVPAGWQRWAGAGSSDWEYAPAPAVREASQR